jgi:[ribosomal protein S5]-alanine N-acetyltransferase
VIKPIIFESEQFLIHPFRQINANRYDSITEDVYKILSDNEVLTFIPEKRLSNKEEAKNFIFSIIAGYEQETSYAYFITIKDINRTIGIINLISPKKTKENYVLEEYNWMIEYYMLKAAWGRNIMSEILPAFKERVLSQGIKKLGAICKQANYGSIRVLEKSGFKKTFKFDLTQDYYEAIQ